MESALQDIVKRMREGGSVVIDGPTAVSRPIQRATKYPLFLNEIVKVRGGKSLQKHAKGAPDFLLNKNSTRRFKLVFEA